MARYYYMTVVNVFLIFSNYYLICKRRLKWSQLGPIRRLHIKKFDNSMEQYTNYTKKWIDIFVKKLIFTDRLYLMNNYYFIDIHYTKYDDKITISMINTLPAKNLFGGGYKQRRHLLYKNIR